MCTRLKHPAVTMSMEIAKNKMLYFSKYHSGIQNVLTDVSKSSVLL